jgi:hypothetical protein
MLRLVVVLTLLLRAGAVTAQSLPDVLPVKALHCALTAPPAGAGIAGTPGGFVMVFPRNAALSDRYTGCKLMWIVDGEDFRRFATLYFSEGRLAVAVAHASRDPAAPIDAACAFPEGRSLLPRAGRQIDDAGCKGFIEDPFYGLRLATWPRSCLTNTEAAVCKQDPR